MSGNALAVVVALSHLLAVPTDRPPHCVDAICVLTGSGGDAERWIAHVNLNRGALFQVQGLCAAACMIAAQQAVIRGERIRFIEGFQLQPFEPATLSGP